MNTFYLEKNPKKITVFQLKNTVFEPLHEFSANEQETCKEFLQKFSPAQKFIAEQETAFDFWLHINTSHNPLNWIEKNIQENSITFDCRLVLILAALSHPKISARNFQEGITLVIEKDFHFLAVLIYKNEIYGAFEHTLQELSPKLLKKDLEEFRFGWLPDEEVLKQKGYGCIIKNIPAEAEGFHPTFIVCEHEEYFKELGRIIHFEKTKETAVQALQTK